MASAVVGARNVDAGVGKVFMRRLIMVGQLKTMGSGVGLGSLGASPDELTFCLHKAQASLSRRAKKKHICISVVSK